MTEAPPPILLVTGLSGAGKSVALKALEDIGYEAVDNLPLSLLDALVNATGADRRLAIGSILFGVGWGIAGLCPGPAVANLALAPAAAAPFLLAMLAGMALHRLTSR